MRIDFSVPVEKRTGVSVYYDDYRKRLAADPSTMKPTSAFRRNNPHPSKNFLEPRRSQPEGAAVQKRVKQAVQNYLNEIHSLQQQNEPRYYPSYPEPLGCGQDLSGSQFLPPSYHRVPNNKLWQSHVIGREARPLSVTGYHINRPSSAFAAERAPPPELEGESKRDRSVRIKESIKESNRLKTPHPNKEAWQRIRTTPVPPQNQPHWVKTTTQNPRSKPVRISSAPPGVQGYTYYPQGPKNQFKMNKDEDMVAKLEAWSEKATNYEKEVIFNMLKQITPRPDEVPTTPEGFQSITEGPAADYHRNGGGNIATQPYGKYLKKRIHSAPIKKMGGLVAASTQRPLHDQRVYRLKGQDIRLDPSPMEERQLKKYLNNLEDDAHALTHKSKKSASVPMHTHLPKKVRAAQDYQCKVSFFQSVRSPFRKHFIIHPDFTSESLKKRKPVSHTITHFRY